jgi:hypothetical protein
MGWALLSDGAPLVRAMARMGGATDTASSVQSVAALQILLARGLGFGPEAARALDLTRPAAVALLNPGFAGVAGTKPVLGLIPVAPRDQVEAALGAAGLAVEKRPWGLAVTTPAGRAVIAFENGYALVAFREELVRAAGSVLRPVLALKSDAPLTVHLDAENVYAAHGAELEVMLGRFAQATRIGSDPQLAFALRSARQLTRYAGSMRALELLIGDDDGGVTVTARVDGKPGSAWADYVAAQKPGAAPWGLAFLPRDAVLIYATRRSGSTAQDELDAAVDYLGDSARPPASEAARAAWKEALGRAIAESGGELVYGVWPGADGGVGIGGAWRIRPGAAARRETFAAYQRIGAGMAGLVSRSLHLEPERFPLAVRVRRDATRLDGVAVDTVEIAVRWPSGSDAERRAF